MSIGKRINKPDPVTVLRDRTSIEIDNEAGAPPNFQEARKPARNKTRVERAAQMTSLQGQEKLILNGLLAERAQEEEDPGEEEKDYRADTGRRGAEEKDS
eukprot:596336-Hanusia_phi.AAC.1